MDIMSILNVVSWVVSICSGVSAVLPNKNAEGKRVFGTIRSILNVLALNVGNAKNKEE